MESRKTSTKWYLDSGCSKHMTGDEKNFTTITHKKGGRVTFGDNNKGHIIGVGTIHLTPTLIIENVLLVDGLKHNLLSISQLCDKDYEVVFDRNMCFIKKISESKSLIMGIRHDNVYTLDCTNANDDNIKCLTAVENNSWLWHRRLGHAHIKLFCPNYLKRS